jgi:hypothetical protein
MVRIMLYSVIKGTKSGVAGVFSAAMLLGGCGGVDLGGSSSASTASSESEPVVLNGGAFKGVISQGQVTAWSLEQPPGSDAVELGSIISKTVMTDSQGRFRLPLDQSADGWVMVELTAGNGSRMTCDVMPQCHVGDNTMVDFGETFPLGSDFRLRAAVNLNTGNRVYLTPLSSLAVAGAQQMTSGLSAKNLTSAYKNMEASFGLNPGTLQLPPPNIVRLNGFKGSTDAVQLAVINAAFLSMVDGEKWDSIEEVLKASETLIRREGGLSETDSDKAPAVRDLVMEAADQSAEIADSGQITDSSVLSSLISAGDRTIAFSRQIENPRGDHPDNQLADNSRNDGRDDADEDVSRDVSNGVGGNDNGYGDDQIVVGDNDTGNLIIGGETGKVPEEPVKELAADAARLSWSAPLTRVNGDKIYMSELEGYEIVYGRAADRLDQAVSIPESGEGAHEYTVEGLDAGEWYFAIRVLDTEGLSSTLSQVVSKSI